jgi:hypothetical protein
MRRAGWLTKPSRDLHFVATAAGLDADALRERCFKAGKGRVVRKRGLGQGLRD